MRPTASCFVLCLLATGALGGCKCEHEDKHPYTPFGVASTLPPTADASVSSRAADAGGVSEFTAHEAAVLSPPAGEVRTQGGRTLEAPEGWLIQQYLDARFVTPTSKADSALAWLVPEKLDSQRSPGELWLLADGLTRKVSSFPAFVPTSEGCTISTSLSRTGPHSVTLDVGSSCNAVSIARAPTRSIEVLRPDREAQPQLLQLRLAPAPVGSQLRVDVSSLDTDADGHDDIQTKFTLTHPGAPESSAAFRWLDRTAGPSREPGEPMKSFTDIGSVEVVRSKGKKTSQRVPARIEGARRLFAYVCAEGGTYGVTDSQGRPLECGALTRALDWFVQAEVQAALTAEDWGSALLALERGDWYGERRSEKLRGQLETAIRKALTSVTPAAHPLPARPLGAGSEPRLSPLTFDTAGRLLVQTIGSVLRFESPSDPGVDASDEIDRWPLIPFGGRGQRVTGLSFPCDQPSVGVVVRTPEGRLEHAYVSEMLAPRPGQCAQRPAQLPLPELRLLGFSGDELAGFIGSKAFGTMPRGAPAGSPRSGSGANSVTVTQLGLLVQTPNGAQLWSTEAGQRLSECVVGNRADRVACIHDQGVVWLSSSLGTAK